MRAYALVLLGLCLAACGGGWTTARQTGEGVTLPAPATSLTFGDLASSQGLDTLWATHAGGLSTVTPRIEGGAALTHTLALPGADPVAAASDGVLTYILDRASERVLVFAGDEQTGFTPRATLEVGARPSALLVANFNEDDRWDLAVANEGSDDVSIIIGGPDSTFLPERRVAVGAQPRALIEADLDHEAGLDLAVADYGANTVSLLLGDSKGGFTRSRDLPVGAGPVAFLPVPTDLDGDDFDDLLVADSLDGTLTVLLGDEGLPRPGPRVSLPGGAASRPVALTYWRLPGGRDAGIDVFVAANGTGALLAIHVAGNGRFGPARTVKALARPLAVQLGLFVGDRRRDLAVADASGHVAFIETPGDRLVAADLRAVTVAAGDGAIVWSRRLGPHRYGLATRRGALAVPESRKDPRPRIGRDAAGRTVLTRLRCGRRACAPVRSTLSGRHGRRVAIHVPDGCRIRDFALAGANLAYVLVRTPAHGCPHASAGLWLRRGSARPHRLSRYADRLGDFQGTWISWFETLYGGSGWRLRLAKLGGKPATVNSGNLDCCLLAGGAIGGGHVYWVESPDTTEASLGRLRLADLRGCQYLTPGSSFPWGGVALDRGRPVLADSFGVFEIDHARWRRC